MKKPTIISIAFAAAFIATVLLMDRQPRQPPPVNVAAQVDSVLNDTLNFRPVDTMYFKRISDSTVKVIMKMRGPGKIWTDSFVKRM